MTDLHKEVQKLLEEVEYLSESERLKTFKKWNFTRKSPCHAEKMAEAGFIFIGDRKNKDLVKCFICQKQLDGWEDDDDPWKEHICHSPKCPFAVLNLPESKMTVSQFLDIKCAFMKSMVELAGQKIVNQLEDAIQELEQM